MKASYVLIALGILIVVVTAVYYQVQKAEARKDEGLLYSESRGYYKDTPDNCRVWFDGCQNWTYSEANEGMLGTWGRCDFVDKKSARLSECLEYMDETVTPTSGN